MRAVYITLKHWISLYKNKYDVWANIFICLFQQFMNFYLIVNILCSQETIIIIIIFDYRYY